MYWASVILTARICKPSVARFPCWTLQGPARSKALTGGSSLPLARSCPNRTDRDVTWHHPLVLARGQLWSAYGGLQDLRLACVNLARLTENFSAAPEGYEKVEQTLTGKQLVPLEATCCPLEQSAMLHAALVIVRFYLELTIPLARKYGIAYPTDLEQVMYGRLEQLLDTG